MLSTTGVLVSKFSNGKLLLARSFDIEDEYLSQNGNRNNLRHSQTNYFEDLLRNQTQLGAALLGVGLLLTLLGIMLFFEGNLLRIGNLCMLIGAFILIGPSQLSVFFLKESRLQATFISSIGVLLVFCGKPKLGLLIELFGLLNLFGNMLPILLAAGRNIPVFGNLLSTLFETDKSNYDINNQENPRDFGRPSRYYNPPNDFRNGYSNSYDPEF